MAGTATFTTLESTIDRNGPASRLNWTSGPSVSGPAGCSVTVFAATAPVLPLSVIRRIRRVVYDTITAAASIRRMRHTFGVTQAGPGSGPSAPELLADATDISRLLREVQRYVEQPQDAAMRESGLTMPQVSTLGVLFDRGPLSLKDLSRELGLSHSTVSGIVDRLERRGLARRAVDPADRRGSPIRAVGLPDAHSHHGDVPSPAGRTQAALPSTSAAERL